MHKFIKIILNKAEYRFASIKEATVQMRLHIAIIFMIYCFAGTATLAQRHELGLFGGGSYYIGDINPKKHFALTQPSFGLIYRYNMNPNWAMRFNIYQGKVESSDAEIRYNQPRNLSFRSNITEIALGLELNFFEYKTGDRKRPASPFIFAGLGYFKFNPQAELDGQWYDLQPLGTEGQGTTSYPDKKPYTLGSFSIPFGVGAKFSFGKTACIAMEWGMRKTFTDYLDDISTTYADPLILSAENSPTAAQLADRTIFGPGEEPVSNVGKQRGDSSTNDWYSFAGITVTFKINTRKDICEGMSRSKRKYKDYKYD